MKTLNFYELSDLAMSLDALLVSDATPTKECKIYAKALRLYTPLLNEAIADDEDTKFVVPVPKWVKGRLVLK